MSVFFTRCFLAVTVLILCSFLWGCTKTPPETTSIPTPTSTASPTPDIANSNYEGFLDEADCNTVVGWAWDKTQKPNDAVYVQIFSDGTAISTIPASAPRWSVAAHTKDAGYHGFIYKVHPTIKDGKPHVISARIANTPYELTGSPKTINCPKP